jgi:hypothetical protein
MNNTHKIITALLIFTTSVHAYEFSFYNDTEYPIAVAIQFTNGENEPLYKQFLKPGTMKSFVPGSVDIPDIKWSFCLRNIYVAKNPTLEQRAHYFAKTPWTKIPIIWTDLPLKSAKKPKRLSLIKKQTDSSRRIVVKKPVIKDGEKSLCRDRHFEITHDEHDRIIVTGSIKESY